MQAAANTRADQHYWYLEGSVDDSKVMRRVPIVSTPFQVGRNPDLSLHLIQPSVSRLHAELYYVGNELVVRDLGSKNGSYLNKNRLARPTPLREGDMLQFADVEFRLGKLNIVPGTNMDLDSTDSMRAPAKLFPVAAKSFRELMETRAIVPLYQPIVELEGGAIYGYEVFGRGNLNGFVSAPRELFLIASTMAVEDQLSRLFRWRGAEEASLLEGSQHLFLKVEPSEIKKPEDLCQSAAELRSAFPDLVFTMELQDSCLADFRRLHEIAYTLEQLNIGLAYVNFSSGLERLEQLTEIIPDYIRFGKVLTQNVHSAPASSQQMIRQLVEFARGVGIVCIADSVENGEDANALFKMGFHGAQGAYFGMPAAPQSAR